MRGVKVGLAFEATAANLDDGGLEVEAHFDLDRTRWGIHYGSSRFLSIWAGTRFTT